MKKIRASGVLVMTSILMACGGGGGGGLPMPPAQAITAPSQPASDSTGAATARKSSNAPATSTASVAPPAEVPAPVWPYLPPVADPFYAQPTAAELVAYPPGAVIRYRKVTTQALYVFPILADAWQILYRSHDNADLPVANSATILVPVNAPATDRKLVSFQAAYDATTTACNPSYGLIRGAMYESAEIPLILAKGWVMVLPDYEGPQAQFGARKTTAHAVLDGIRAAQNFPLAGLAGTQTPVALMGYSGGALATAQTAEVHPDYAPELVIKGVTLGGLPADFSAAIRSVDGGLFSAFAWIPLIGLDRAEPGMHLSSYLNDQGRAAVSFMGQSCVLGVLQGSAEAALNPYTFRSLREFTTVQDVLSEPDIAAAFARNTLGQAVPRVPMLIYTGLFEELVPVPPIRALAGKYCQNGVKVKTQTVLGGHAIGVATGLPLAVDYLADRFAGRSAPSNCP